MKEKMSFRNYVDPGCVCARYKQKKREPEQSITSFVVVFRRGPQNKMGGGGGGAGGFIEEGIYFLSNSVD